MSTSNENEVVTEETVEGTTEEVVVEPAYTLRVLASKDVFLMSKIISKIGINEFVKTFESPAIRKLIGKSLDSDPGTGEETSDSLEDNLKVVGVGVALEISNVILTNLASCEMEIYKFLSSLSGMSEVEVMELPMSVFFEMIIDVCKKEEFKDFIKVVSKLFK